MMPDLEPVTEPATLKWKVRICTRAMIAFGNLSDYGYQVQLLVSCAVNKLQNAGSRHKIVLVAVRQSKVHDHALCGEGLVPKGVIPDLC